MKTENIAIIIGIIAKQAGREESEIRGDDRLADLSIDSLDMCEIQMEVEDALDVEIIDFDMRPAITVAEYMYNIQTNCVGAI